MLVLATLTTFNSSQIKMTCHASNGHKVCARRFVLAMLIALYSPPHRQTYNVHNACMVCGDSVHDTEFSATQSDLQRLQSGKSGFPTSADLDGILISSLSNDETEIRY